MLPRLQNSTKLKPAGTGVVAPPLGKPPWPDTK
jgi:hypothetical protein